MKTYKPMYSQIFDYLKGKIINNELSPYQQVPTEMELAEQFEVSRITSKRALAELEKDGLIYRERGKGSFVKPRKVTGPAKWDSRPQGISKMISMLIPNQGIDGRPFDYIIGANDYLASRGYYLSVHTYLGKVDVARSFLQSLPQKGAQGIIYYPANSNANLDIINLLHMNDYPIVTIDKYVPVPTSCVVSDNFTGGRLAVTHLIKHGHTRIGYISTQGIETTTSGRDRYFGYCRGLKDYGIDIDLELVALELNHQIKQSSNKHDFYKRLIDKLMRLKVTAIQTVNDLTAIDLIKACTDMGISIPDQLSVIGFDDLEISKHLDVPLTSIAQDFVKIGQKAAEVLINKLESKDYTQQKVILPVELVERRSSGPIRLNTEKVI